MKRRTRLEGLAARSVAGAGEAQAGPPGARPR
jgi:hypothetical protein